MFALNIFIKYNKLYMSESGVEIGSVQVPAETQKATPDKNAEIRSKIHLPTWATDEWFRRQGRVLKYPLMSGGLGFAGLLFHGLPTAVVGGAVGAIGAWFDNRRQKSNDNTEIQNE
jgi:hypothetical protein